MTRLIFVIDPMCSWCWGFHPVIETLRTKYRERYTISLVVGGLRTSGQMLWNDESKAYLHQHWKTVSEKTGQPFSPVLLNRSDFDYDTYPSCKAVVTVKELWGEESAFDYLSKIQEAFYAKGEDITSAEILSSYLSEDPNEFKTFFESKRAEDIMHNDFDKARAMGANIFPSTVKIDEDGHMVCIKGYKSLEEILYL